MAESVKLFEKLLVAASLFVLTTADPYYNETLSSGCTDGVEVKFLHVPGFGHRPRCCEADTIGEGSCDSHQDQTACTIDDVGNPCVWYEGYCYNAKNGGKDEEGKDEEDKDEEGKGVEASCSDLKDETACQKGDADGNACSWYEGYGCYSTKDEGKDEDKGSCEDHKDKAPCDDAAACTWYDGFGCYGTKGRRAQQTEVRKVLAGADESFPVGWDSQATVWEFMNRWSKEITFLEPSDIGNLDIGSLDGCSDTVSASTEKNNCDEGESRCSLAFFSAPRTCISHKGFERCWFTYTPPGLDQGGRLVPLIVDMHGGGGCAKDEAVSSGMKELADQHGGVVVWPQSASTSEGGQLWGVHGLDTPPSGMDADGKPAILSDDIGFLKKLVSAVAAANQGVVDPRKVYASGFSMGCMMAQRFAYDASDFVAAVGCHGGPLISGGETSPAALKSNPTSVIVVAGMEDSWAPLAQEGAVKFTGYFQCTTTNTKAVRAAAYCENTQCNDDNGKCPDGTTAPMQAGGCCPDTALCTKDQESVPEKPADDSCSNMCDPDTTKCEGGMCVAHCGQLDNCCSAGGCQDDAYVQCVGAFDPFCEELGWDTQCISEAQMECSLVC